METEFWMKLNFSVPSDVLFDNHLTCRTSASYSSDFGGSDGKSHVEPQWLSELTPPCSIVRGRFLTLRPAKDRCHCKLAEWSNKPMS